MHHLNQNFTHSINTTLTFLRANEIATRMGRWMRINDVTNTSWNKISWNEILQRTECTERKFTTKRNYSKLNRIMFKTRSNYDQKKLKKDTETQQHYSLTKVKPSGYSSVYSSVYSIVYSSNSRSKLFQNTVTSQ